MKILQINNVYAQQSTGKITKLIHDSLLAAGHESIVVYGRGKTYRGAGVIRLCPDWYGKLNHGVSRLTGLMYGGCFLSTARLKAIIRREKPDVVHLQCINGYFVNIYSLIRWLKIKKIKTVISLHAEFMYTANCGHAFECDQWKKGCRCCPDKKKATKSFFFDNTGRSWRKMRAAFDGFQENCVIVPVSPWTEERAKMGDILKDFPFCTIYNGIDTTTFSCPDVTTKRENLVAHVTAHFVNERDHPKGGWYLAELAKRMPEVTFCVAGRVSAGEDVPENVKLLGVIREPQALAELYRRAKVSVLVSKRETFSMPCAESLCCGTPVVGFKAGAPEQIALAAYSDFVEFGDLDGLETLIRHWLEQDISRGDLTQLAGRTYSAEVMVDQFERLYRSVL